MIKDITFYSDEDFKKIQAGVDKLANVVKTTLGPGGTNVILELGHLQAVTKDGVTVAEQVWLEDPLENIGAQIVKRVAQKTVKEAGDGTTTATVLAQAILREGLAIALKGLSKPIEVKRSIDIAVAAVVKEIKAMAKPVAGDDIYKVALISSNGDKEIGKLVGDAITEVGLEGLVTVEDSRSLDTYVKKVDGMRWDRGYKSHFFITNRNTAQCELLNPVILIVDGNVTSLREIMPNAQSENLISRYREDKEIGARPLLIIANDFGAEAISAFAMNHTNNAIQCCLVEAPDFQDVRKSIMQDIAAATGATVFSKEAGHTWANVTPEILGRCESVRVTQWTTTIIGGAGGLRASVRAQEIREQMRDTNEHALEVLKSRLARLVNGLSVFYVGGSSEIEVQEKKDRIDDALNATRAAIEEGVLPGGGVSLMRISESNDFFDMLMESDNIGPSIIRNAIKEPFMAICENVGLDPKICIQSVLKSENLSFGVNAATMKYEDLIVAGVIDPAKVVRLALENAASVAGMLLTTKAVVSNKRPKQ